MDPSLAAKLIAVPLIGGATGYLTNYIAVRMLFRPRRERRLLGFVRLQGLVPRRRDDIAERIGETVEAHLLSHEDIKRALDDPEAQSSVERMLHERLNQMLDEKIARMNPMFAMIMKGDVRQRIHKTLMEELLRALPAITENMMDSLEERLDFRAIVVEKIRDFDLDRFEEIILRIASRELRAIEVLGGALGFGIGLLTDLLFLF
ncbi:DUF445 family protein [Candidatus Sumerlaeota bacterium]|nr:DUF445 family protein [Candidatus Sumerlaeota bacterium]